MNHGVIMAIIGFAGFLTGMTWILFSGAGFAAKSRWIEGRGSINRTTDLADLGVILLCISASGGYLLLAVVGAMWLINPYPEWRASSDLFWYGIVAAVVAARLFRLWRGRW